MDGYDGAGKASSRCTAMGKESFIAPEGLDVTDVLWMIAGRVKGAIDARGGTESSLRMAAMSGYEMKDCVYGMRL